MFRCLYADTRNVFLSKGFRIGLGAIIVFQMLGLLFSGFIVTFVMKEALAADDIAFIFPTVAAFLVTATTLHITENEFSDGCMRNKIISGVRRSDVFLSAILGGMLQGVIYSILACITSIVIAVFFTGGFMTYSIPEIADYWLVITLACLTIGAFSNVLILTLCGSKISYIIGLALAFVLRVADTHVLDKLYPSSGLCTLTGTKLAVYQFFDRFIPYAYLTTEPHYDMASYVLGCGGFILISTITGLLIFEKKELK